MECEELPELNVRIDNVGSSRHSAVMKHSMAAAGWLCYEGSLLALMERLMTHLVAQ